MNSRKRFELNVKIGIRKPEDDVTIIEQLVNKLIDNLYLPVTHSAQFVTDRKKLTEYKIDGEPINFGALQVSEVTRRGDWYLVTIEEASPNDCPMLCEYIEKFMQAWGWNVKCETEW